MFIADGTNEARWRQSGRRPGIDDNVPPFDDGVVSRWCARGRPLHGSGGKRRPRSGAGDLHTSARLAVSARLNHGHLHGDGRAGRHGVVFVYGGRQSGATPVADEVSRIRRQPDGRRSDESGDEHLIGRDAELHVHRRPIFVIPDPAHRVAASAVSAQTAAIVVENAGLPGERAQDAAKRLPSVMATTRPEVLLLLSGVNELRALGDAGVPVAWQAIDTMAKEARSRGARVFLATLPPPRPGGRNSTPRRRS